MPYQTLDASGSLELQVTVMSSYLNQSPVLTPTVLSGLAVTDATMSRLVRMNSKKNFFISHPIVAILF